MLVQFSTDFIIIEFLNNFIARWDKYELDFKMIYEDLLASV